MVQDNSLAQTQLVHGSLKPISEGKPDFTAGTQNLSQSYASALGTDDKIYLVKPPGVEFKKINYTNGRIELEQLALNPNTDRGSDFAIKSANRKSNTDSQDLILSPSRQPPNIISYRNSTAGITAAEKEKTASASDIRMKKRQ